MTPLTIILCLVFAVLGWLAGALVQRAHDRKVKPPAAVPSSEEQAPGLASKEGSLESVRIDRQLSGRITLEMDGLPVKDRNALLPGQRLRLKRLLGELAGWSDEHRPNPPSPEATVPEAYTSAQAGDPLAGRINPGQGRSIVEQIDSLLQARLPSSPLSGRSIHLAEGSAGSVLIHDGMTTYEGIGSVPDPQLKALLQQAVEDWETKHR
jgi:hypothetical protein